MSVRAAFKLASTTLTRPPSRWACRVHRRVRRDRTRAAALTLALGSLLGGWTLLAVGLVAAGGASLGASIVACSASLVVERRRQSALRRECERVLDQAVASEARRGTGDLEQWLHTHDS